jgi:excisionase family DNA binding protein
MEGYVIITSKEELRQIIREVLSEVSPPDRDSSTGPTGPGYLNMDKLLDFLRENNCRISKSRIYKLARAKQIPHRKIGKHLMFRTDDILEWLSGDRT